MNFKVLILTLLFLSPSFQAPSDCLPLLAFTGYYAYKVYSDIQEKQMDMAVFDGLDLVKLLYLDYKCFKNTPSALAEYQEKYSQSQRECVEREVESFLGEMRKALTTGEIKRVFEMDLDLKKCNH